MEIDILTLFPEMFSGPFACSILKRAQDKGIIQIRIHNFRDYSTNKHHTVDDTPYGGGTGMILKPEPIFYALQAMREVSPTKAHVVLLTPQGEKLGQKIVEELAGQERIIFICGHYEGYDERIREHMVDQEISIGDYILTGGEIPALAVTDAVVRLLPGVLGNDESACNESFGGEILEFPQYTKPSVFQGWAVPEILLSGDHGKVAKWRHEQAMLRTTERRPDLLKKRQDPSGSPDGNNEK